LFSFCFECYNHFGFNAPSIAFCNHFVVSESRVERRSATSVLPEPRSSTN